MLRDLEHEFRSVTNTRQRRTRASGRSAHVLPGGETRATPRSRVYAYASPGSRVSGEIVNSMHENHVVDVRVARRRIRHMPPQRASRRAASHRFPTSTSACIAGVSPSPATLGLTIHYFRIGGGGGGREETFPSHFTTRINHRLFLPPTPPPISHFHGWNSAGLRPQQPKIILSALPLLFPSTNPVSSPRPPLLDLRLLFLRVSSPFTCLFADLPRSSPRLHSIACSCARYLNWSLSPLYYTVR